MINIIEEDNNTFFETLFTSEAKCLKEGLQASGSDLYDTISLYDSRYKEYLTINYKNDAGLINWDYYEYNEEIYQVSSVFLFVDFIDKNCTPYSSCNGNLHIDVCSKNVFVENIKDLNYYHVKFKDREAIELRYKDDPVFMVAFNNSAIIQDIASLISKNIGYFPY